MLKLYNSLTRKLEEFSAIGVSISGGKPVTVGLYTCGPTVYNFAHIGNLRTYLFEDVLKRVLIYDGFAIKHVMNITDVGHLSGDQDFAKDKMEKEGGNAKEILDLAKKYTDAFLMDLKTLNILQADILAPATEHIGDQIKLIEKLFDKGFAYETELAVYFDVSKFPNYGQLTSQKMEEKKVGARADIVIDKNKKRPVDFALWFKLAGKYKNHILRWESPWGLGFPGWHVECSAMSNKYLGQPFDIHAGGVDLKFPHHTNEMAQSEAAEAKPLANYWLHGEHLLINEGRMGKSEGNLLALQTLVDKGFNPLAYRYLVLTSHYRSKLNFTWDSLSAAQNALNNFYQEISIYDPAKVGCAEYEQHFLDAVNNDLDTPKALAIVWDMIKSEYPGSAKLQSLIRFDSVLGLKIKEVWEAAKATPDVVRKLVDEREEARKAKDFIRSDELRCAIESNGYIVEDTVDGVRVKKKF